MHQVRKTQANVPPQQELQTEHEVPQALQGVHLQYLPVLQQPHPLPCQTPEQEVKELKTPSQCQDFQFIEHSCFFILCSYVMSGILVVFKLHVTLLYHLIKLYIYEYILLGSVVSYFALYANVFTFLT